MTLFKLCLTFDIDFADHTLAETAVDEVEAGVPSIKAVFEANPGWTATWFVRLDAHLEKHYGDARYIFQKHGGALDELRRMGHELGWHPHSYAMRDGAWRQNTDERSVLEELARYAPVARSLGLNCVRMGWGYQTVKTMRLLSDAGFKVDSSAIPRPVYDWEESVKNWESAPTHPYFPSSTDYRRPGASAIPILEVPMSVARISAPYDTGVVLRYINPAYKPSYFSSAIEQWVAENTHLVTITHPYELMPHQRPHPLLAFNIADFEANIAFLTDRIDNAGKTIQFATLTEFASDYPYDAQE